MVKLVTSSTCVTCFFCFYLYESQVAHILVAEALLLAVHSTLAQQSRIRMKIKKKSREVLAAPSSLS